MRLARVVFPEKPRSFPGQRLAKVCARALHVLCAAALFGGHVVGAEPERVAPWLVATIGSGCGILLLDLYQSGAFLVQVRGIVLLAKIVLLWSLQWLPDHGATILGVIVVVSVLSSHAPSRFRYFVVIGRGRFEAARTPG